MPYGKVLIVSVYFLYTLNSRLFKMAESHHLHSIIADIMLRKLVREKKKLHNYMHSVVGFLYYKCIFVVEVWHHFLEQQQVQVGEYVTFRRLVVVLTLLRGQLATASAIFTFQVIDSFSFVS